jgi:hypothetical protein
MVKNPNLTFVTSFIQLTTRDIQEYIKHFKKLVVADLKIICFICDKDINVKNILQPFLKHDNLCIVGIDKSKLSAFQLFNKQTQLPTNRTIDKDNLEFLQLMNAKIELVSIAMKINTTSNYFAWIDFAIMKIIKDNALAINRLFVIEPTASKISIPGCWSKRDPIQDKICWRFCGGFFIGDRSTIEIFNEKNIEMLNKYSQMNLITWETNIWAEIESETPELFDWYLADHNDTIFDKPPEKKQLPDNKKEKQVQNKEKQIFNNQPEIQDNNKKEKQLQNKEKQIFNNQPEIQDNNKIMLITMVKNEEKVLERLLLSVLFCVDAILIADTGSTDQTCKIAERLSRELTIPIHVATSEWKNFGHNRSVSFLQAQEYCKNLRWNANKVWGLLLDGDMILKKGPTFNKQILQNSSYMLVQKNAIIDYYNTRLVRLSDPWKCTGVTHEYWDGPSRAIRLETEYLWITDVGDGGCKSNKLARDILLLEQGIKDEPNCERYYFYLAQSYKDIGNFKKAIELYKVRISKGGWAEEVWHSYYTIAKCYKELGMPYKTELWGNRAYEFRKSRAEPIYLLAQMFRNRGENFKSYHYCKMGKKIPYPNNDLLFIEKNIYTHLFDYELTINHYYVYPERLLEGAKITMNYIKDSRDNWDNTFSNLQFYASHLCNIKNVKSKQLVFECPDTDFKPSSISILKRNERIMANVRFVNYIINPNGSYNMRENGIFSPKHNVRTKNGFVFFDSKLNPSSELIMMNDSIGLPTFNANIKGLEDIRIFAHKKDIYYTATTKEYSEDKSFRIVMGHYDFRNISYTDSIVMLPPVHTICEKNWIAISNGNDIDIIYKWYPLQIGRIGSDNVLKIINTQDTPYYFHNVRGSSPIIEYDNKLWCVTHSVIYSTPRKYLHNIVILEKSSYKLLKYSLPFCFTNVRIEYCLGFIEMNGNFVFTFSVHDADPHILSVPINWFVENIMDW